MNSPPPDPIRIAVRAYTEVQKGESEGASGGWLSDSGWPDYVLLFDTETTTDPTQRLLFGAWQVCEWTPEGLLRVLKQGLFHADDLKEQNPEGYGILKDYAEARRFDFKSRQKWVDRTFHRVAYGARALVCGFNLPFDLTRIAVHSGEARKSFLGGFSLSLSRYSDEEEEAWKENTYVPRVRIKTLDSKRALIGFATPGHGGTYRPGRFLDLRTLAFALTNESHSLASACEAFGVTEGKGTPAGHGEITPGYVDYARQDVRATAGLLEALRAEYDRHPMDRPAWKVYSPASIAKGYLGAMGLTPPREKFDTSPGTLGKTMVAYYGGRSECRVRRTEVPVVYVDFLSMYPTVNALMGIWEILTARDLKVEPATDEVRKLLDQVSAEDCFDPELWSRLRFFAKVKPQGDVLPVRGEYDPHTRNQNIGVNPFHAEEALWYAGPDLVASVLLTGKVPEVLEAFRLTPEGTQPGLEEVELRGEVTVDPVAEDFFRRVIELRKDPPDGLREEDERRLDTHLKVVANSGAYGIYAEMNPGRTPESNPDTVDVYGLREAFEHETTRPEEPGVYCFPPVAALTTAAARLMLALLEVEAGRRGGVHAFCDTDSMALVASQKGGLVPCPGGPERTEDGQEAVRALSWEEVDEIVARFESLKPYDPDAVPGPVLEVEKENYTEEGERRQLWTYTISAKRYVLYRREEGEIEVVKASEHGLGHLLNPVDPEAASTAWIEELWTWIVREARGEDVDLPAWMDRPAVSRLTISSPHLRRPFAEYNEGRPYNEQIKPMNFLLSVSTKGVGELPGTDPERFHLVAPYTRDPERWAETPWLERYSGQEVPITTRTTASALVAEVKSYRDVYEAYRRHPEVTSLGPDGEVCGEDTVGLLRLRSVRALWIDHVGKESNRLEEVEKGAVQDLGEVRETYEAPGQDYWGEIVVPWMKTKPARELAEVTGLSERQIRALRNYRAHPNPNTFFLLSRLMSSCQFS